jgi:hypothetical protein
MLVLLVAMGVALFAFGCGFVFGTAYGVYREQWSQTRRFHEGRW